MTRGQEKETDLSTRDCHLATRAPLRMHVCLALCGSYMNNRHALMGRAATTGNRCFGPAGVRSHTLKAAIYLFLLSFGLMLSVCDKSFGTQTEP